MRGLGEIIAANNAAQAKHDAKQVAAVEVDDSLLSKTAVKLGQYHGLTELVEKNLITPEQFKRRCIEVLHEHAK